MEPEVGGSQPASVRLVRQQPHARVVAPYIAYSRVRELLRKLGKSGIPEQLDERALRSLSTAAANHLRTALKFLRLTDADCRPTDLLRHLAQAPTPTDQRDMLALTIRHSYSPIFRHDLAAMAPDAFVATFDRNYAGTDGVRRKSRTFFLHAARDAGIVLHPDLSRATKLRREPAGPRRAQAKPRSTAVSTATAPLVPPLADPSQASRSLSTLLLAAIDTRRLGEAQRQAFWTVLQLLKDHGL